MRGAPDGTLVAILDAWVSLVLRDFTGAHRITWNWDRGITGFHEWVTVIHSSAARWRWRRVWNPVHAALIKGVGHIYICIYI